MPNPESATRRGDKLVVAASLLLLAGTALLDYLTPPAVNFGLIYMLAVLPVAWVSGWRVAIVIAVIATALEGINAQIIRAQPWEVIAWNALSRIVVLSLMAVIADRLYLERARWQRIHAERGTLLRLLEREFPRPLKALDWFSRMLEESLERGATDAAWRQIAPLRHHIRETTFLATDLLAVGSLQAGALHFKQEQADFRELVNDAAAETLERARVLVPAPADLIAVRCDPEHVRHAIAIVLERCLQGPYEPLPLFLRATATEAVLEISRPGEELDRADLELADLLITGCGGRITITPRNAKRGAVVAIILPLAVRAGRPISAPVG